MDKRTGMYGGQTGDCATDCHGKMLPGEVLVIGMSQSRGKWVSWWIYHAVQRWQKGENLLPMHIWLSLSCVCTAQVMEGCSALQPLSSLGLLCAASECLGAELNYLSPNFRQSGYGKEGGGSACWAAGDQGGREGKGENVQSQRKAKVLTPGNGKSFCLGHGKKDLWSQEQEHWGVPSILYPYFVSFFVIIITCYMVYY